MFRPAQLFLYSSIVVMLAACEKPSSSRVSTSFNTGAPETISQAPYLLPRCFDADEPQDLKINISAVGSHAMDKADCAVPAKAENKDFSLDWSTSTVTSIPVRVAEVTVSAGAVYSESDKDRKRLKTSFEAFLRELSKREEDPENACLNAGDTAVIRDRVASALPLRLDEILSYHYGFDSANRVIDLQPGMRLRIEQSAYQYVSKGNESNAYVGSGTAYLQVVRRPDQSLTFDPYLGSIDALEARGEGTGRTRMISGAMGLVAVGVSQRYARLVYPATYPTTDNATAVTAENELPDRVALLLANRVDKLEEATEDYVSSSECAANEENRVHCFYFSGRSFVVPEVMVRIQGVEKYVAVGTTVKDTIGQYAVMPTRQIGNRNEGGFSPVLQRGMQPGLCRSGANYQSVRILFEQQSPDTPSSLSQWDMPLLKGDQLHW